MLTWVAGVVFGEGLAGRRRLRQRGRFLSLDRLARLTCRLALIRAVEITGVRARRRTVRNTAPAGFRRRIAPRALRRACLGARLRKALNRGDLKTRIEVLTAALTDIDAFARRYLVARARRGLTRLCAVVLIAPAADVLLSAPASAPACADSS